MTSQYISALHSLRTFLLSHHERSGTEKNNKILRTYKRIGKERNPAARLRYLMPTEWRCSVCIMTRARGQEGVEFGNLEFNRRVHDTAIRYSVRVSRGSRSKSFFVMDFF